MSDIRAIGLDTGELLLKGLARTAGLVKGRYYYL
jgi:hypothetical protein